MSTHQVHKTVSRKAVRKAAAVTADAPTVSERHARWFADADATWTRITAVRGAEGMTEQERLDRS
jgi:hypothetical protein